MHGAPSVSYLVGRSRFQGVFLAGVTGVSLMNLGAWASRTQPAAWAACAVFAAWAATSAWAFAAWWRTPVRPVAWDGECWRLGACDAVGAVHPVADLQRWVLLRWTAPQARGAWLWLERRSDPARWDALRRAVYSRARPEAPAGDLSGPAKP